MTAAEQWQAAIAELPAMERQAVLAGMLEIVEQPPQAYVLHSGASVLFSAWPSGGTWSRKVGRRLVRARGLTSRQASTLAHDEIQYALHQPDTVVAVARPTMARGLIVGWAAARGDTLVLCHTLPGLRRCGVQRMLWELLFEGGKPRLHAYEPRGTGDFLRRIGTELAP